MQVVSIPLGTTGTLAINESAGVITVAVTEAILSGGVTMNLSIAGGLPALLKMAASATSNQTVAALLGELGALSAALPA